MIEYRYNFFKRRKFSVGTGLFKRMLKRMLKGTKTTKATVTIKTLDQTIPLETFAAYYKAAAETVAGNTGTFVSAVITPGYCVKDKSSKPIFTISATRDPKDCPYFLEDWKEAILKIAKILKGAADGEYVYVEFSEVECISVE